MNVENVWANVGRKVGKTWTKERQKVRKKGKGQKGKAWIRAAKVIETAAMMKTAAKVAKGTKARRASMLQVNEK